MNPRQTLGECLEQANRLNSISDEDACDKLIEYAKSSDEQFNRLVRKIDREHLLSMLGDYLENNEETTAMIFGEIFGVQSKHCGDSIAYVGAISE